MRVPLLIILGNLIFSSILLSIIVIFPHFLDTNDILNFLPGPTATDAAILFFLPYLFIPILAIALAPVFIHFFIFLAKIFKFGLYDVGHCAFEKKFSTPEMISRSFIAAFFALTLGLNVTELFININAEIIPNSTPGTLMIITLLLTIPAAAIQGPMWWTEDLGVMLVRKQVRYLTAPDIQSVRRFMNLLVRGFITINTPILYFSLLSRETVLLRYPQAMALMILFPFAMMGYYIPLQYWFIKRFPNFKRRILLKLRLPPVDVQITFQKNP